MYFPSFVTEGSELGIMVVTSMIKDNVGRIVALCKEFHFPKTVSRLKDLETELIKKLPGMSDKPGVEPIDLQWARWNFWVRRQEEDQDKANARVEFQRKYFDLMKNFARELKSQQRRFPWINSRELIEPLLMLRVEESCQIPVMDGTRLMEEVDLSQVDLGRSVMPIPGVEAHSIIESGNLQEILPGDPECQEEKMRIMDSTGLLLEVSMLPRVEADSSWRDKIVVNPKTKNKVKVSSLPDELQDRYRPVGMTGSGKHFTSDADHDESRGFTSHDHKAAAAHFHQAAQRAQSAGNNKMATQHRQSAQAHFDKMKEREDQDAGFYKGHGQKQ